MSFNKFQKKIINLTQQIDPFVSQQEKYNANTFLDKKKLKYYLGFTNKKKILEEYVKIFIANEFRLLFLENEKNL